MGSLTADIRGSLSQLITYWWDYLRRRNAIRVIQHITVEMRLRVDSLEWDWHIILEAHDGGELVCASVCSV